VHDFQTGLLVPQARISGSSEATGRWIRGAIRFGHAGRKEGISRKQRTSCLVWLLLRGVKQA
jgi:hypothetical protein